MVRTIFAENEASHKQKGSPRQQKANSVGSILEIILPYVTESRDQK